ncbi:hypothetical protein B0H13DRAFT_1876285 [Mycena leptocephala]|nr:hypothetical protein B0H13DRAFT_1876285 [Mycena leptocephala]
MNELDSGHSIKVESLRSKSEDGKDECLVPLDGEEMKITDNELHASLVAPLPAGAHLVAVLDTCYLGSLLGITTAIIVSQYHGSIGEIETGKNLGTGLTSGPAHRVHKAPSMPAKRRSISTAPPMHILTGLERAGTGSGPAKGPLARLRNASASARARAASLSLSLSIPAPASEDNENLTEGAVGPALSAISKLTWSLLDEEAHCESPVGQFPCNGWCRNLEGTPHGEVNADVVSLASRDSQEADGVSMTSSLIVLVGRSTASLDVTRLNPSPTSRQCTTCPPTDFSHRFSRR